MFDVKRPNYWVTVSPFVDPLKTALSVEKGRERRGGNDDREDERDCLTSRIRQPEMEATSKPHTTRESDSPFPGLHDLRHLCQQNGHRRLMVGKNRNICDESRQDNWMVCSPAFQETALTEEVKGGAALK